MPWKIAGQIARYQYEPVVFKIANGMTYRPDWRAVESNGKVRIYEVKGAFVYEGSTEKLKSAAFLYPEYEWYLCQWKSGQWTIQKVLP